MIPMGYLYKRGIVENGELEGCEPGPYRIFAVYSIPA